MAFKKYYYISLSCSISCVTFLVLLKMIWPVWRQIWGLDQIWVFNVFLGFSLKIYVFRNLTS